MTTSLTHRPDGRWEFDDAVTDAFEDMLRRSIPQLDVMRQTVTDLATVYAQPNTDLVDLGCSRGDALEPLVRRFGAYNRCVGVDVSEPMRAAATERFRGYVNQGVVKILATDLRDAYPPVRASVTLAVLTLQFVPIEYRQRLVEAAYEHTLPGGAFIVVEKVLGDTARLDRLFVERYLDLKRANGYDDDAIARKRLSLEGVLVPVTARWNEQLLRDAGFAHVDCFWRWLNFAGWIAVRRDG